LAFLFSSLVLERAAKLSLRLYTAAEGRSQPSCCSLVLSLSDESNFCPPPQKHTRHCSTWLLAAVLLMWLAATGCSGRCVAPP
jgi:hypothetical protein